MENHTEKMNQYSEEEMQQALADFLDKMMDQDEGIELEVVPENTMIRKVTMDEEDTLKVTIGVLPDSYDSLYTSGLVQVGIRSNGKKMMDLGRFQCFVFNEHYFPMGSSVDSAETSRLTPQHVLMEFSSQRVWLPGSYTLFVYDELELVLYRIGFTLDEELNVSMEDDRTCLPYSMEETLVTLRKRPLYDWEALAVQPGSAQLRQHALKCLQLKRYNELRESLGKDDLKLSGNLLITTHNRDFGRDVLRCLADVVLPDYTFNYVDASQLYDVSSTNPYETLSEYVTDTDKQVFCLTNVSVLLASGGKVIVKKLVDKMRGDRDRFVLWICGNRQELNGVFDVFPTLRDYFPLENQLEQQPYAAHELVQALFSRIEAEGIEMTAEVKNELARFVLREHRQGTLASWTVDGISRFVTDEIRPRYRARAYRRVMDETLPSLSMEDVPLNQLTDSFQTYEECIRELDQMVGLDDVKQGITTMAYNTRFCLERRRRNLPTSDNVAYHCIFTGNPGTGKTTVARKLGKIYHALGLLSKGDVMAVDRTRLVGRYIGETEENMKAVLEEARGNVLFIDEAYTLYDGGGDRKDFGGRVIDSLLTVLTQPDPDMLVIFAGYEKEMDAMLSTNPGLAGRFPYKYRFIDYNADQLMEIACRLFSRDAYELTDEARRQLKEAIAQTYASRTENFGNARWVEQFVRNGVVPAMAARLATTGSDDYVTIEAADIRRAYEKFNPKAVELRPRRKVGFSA